MSHSSKKYSYSLKTLDLEVKKKAYEIACLLSEAGFEKEVVEVIAHSNAKLWTYYNNSLEHLKAIHLHLVPHPKGWALITEDALSIFFIYVSKNDALIKARTYAKLAKLRLYLHSPSGDINDYESFVVNRPQTIIESSKNVEAKSNNVHDIATVLIENERDALRRARRLSRNSTEGLIILNKEEGRGQQLTLGI
jgi:hypothetical protein